MMFLHLALCQIWAAGHAIKWPISCFILLLACKLFLVLLFGLDLSCLVYSLIFFFYTDHFWSGSLCLAALAICSQASLVMPLYFLVLQKIPLVFDALLNYCGSAYTHLCCEWVVIGMQHYFLLMNLFNSFMSVFGRSILYMMISIKLPSLPLSILHLQISLAAFSFKFHDIYQSDAVKLKIFDLTTSNSCLSTSLSSS